MPEYRYQAQDSKGANVRGKMNAVDEADLQKKLHNQKHNHLKSLRP